MARNTQAPEGTSPGTELNQDSLSTSKGRPTPTRKEKEAARKRPLVANDRTERRRQEREAAAAMREKQRIGMANGEEKYLPIRDRGVQKRYVRDYVDARWSLGELLLPFIALFFIASFFPQFPAIVTISVLVMWVILLIAIVDIVILGFVLRKKLAAKFGSVDRGVSFYAGLRSVYLRPMRLPKPQVKRGQFPS